MLAEICICTDHFERTFKNKLIHHPFMISRLDLLKKNYIRLLKEQNKERWSYVHSAVSFE